MAEETKRQFTKEESKTQMDLNPAKRGSVSFMGRELWVALIFFSPIVLAEISKISEHHVGGDLGSRNQQDSF